MNRSRGPLLAAGFFLTGHFFLFSGVGASTPEPEVLAWVNGEAVTVTDLELSLGAMGKPRGNVEVSSPAVLRRLIQNRLLEQEGYRMGADQNPEVKNQVQNLVSQKSMLALMDSVSAEVEAVDQEGLDQRLGRTNTMFRVSHILVEERGSAEALLDSLANGVSFSDLARRASRDTTSAKKGGDLGWAGEGKRIPEIEEAIQGLSKGEVAGPVQTEHGWHVLQVTDIHVETIGQSEKMKTAIRDAEMTERVMAAIQDYVSSLKDKYNVVVDEKKLASLDYGSEDQKVHEELRRSDAVLCEIDGRPLTVSGLTFQIRFRYFHGTDGKPDAPRIRDSVFDEWLTETLLRHEARVQGYPNRPDIAAEADFYERKLVRDEVIKVVLQKPIQPTNEDIADYYADHLEEFVPEPRLRVDGVFLADKATADRFREKLEAGAGVSWLADRTPEVRDPSPAALSGWLEPETVGEAGRDFRKGTVLGPVMVEGEWAVMKVLEVEEAKPTPLSECADKVASKWKQAQTQKALEQALDRLESQAEVQVESRAEQAIQQRLDQWLGPPTESGNS